MTTYSYEEKLLLDEKLIKLVQENNVLYDKASRGYKNTSKKAEVWKKISDLLGETELYCTNRWKSLRDKFGRELKAIKNKPSGSSQNLRPEWELYTQMLFLKDFVAPKPTKGNVKISDDSRNSTELSLKTSSIIDEEFIDDETNDGTYDSLNESTYSQPSKKNKITNNNKEIGQSLMNTMDSFKSFIESRKTGNKNNFGERVQILISGLKENSREIAKKKILQYLCQCRYFDLNEESIDEITV